MPWALQIDIISNRHFSILEIVLSSSVLFFGIISYSHHMASIAGSDDEVFSKGNFHDQFAQATGLKINFHKSTVPMHVPVTSVDAMVSVLQCQQGAFPQTYLGFHSPTPNSDRLPSHP